jgi:hypothetical protein
MTAVASGLLGTLATLGRAIRARPLLFAGVALAVVALDLFLPVVVLSVFRKPFDHFSFNPWLKHAPAWALSRTIPLGRKIEFLTNVALFWFIASSPYDEPAWGFSASPPDVVRWLYMGAVLGAYFALCVYARRRRAFRTRWTAAQGGRSGAAGAVLSTLGLFTSPCGVAGCGAPILPVLGLALQGLTSGTLALLATISHVASLVVLIGTTLAVLALAWLIHRAETAGTVETPAVGRTRPGPEPA